MGIVFQPINSANAQKEFKKMKWHHWVILLVIALVSYMAGVMYPGPGANLKAKVMG